MKNNTHFGLLNYVINYVETSSDCSLKIYLVPLFKQEKFQAANAVEAVKYRNKFKIKKERDTLFCGIDWGGLFLDDKNGKLVPID